MNPSKSPFFHSWRIILGLALFKLLIHLLTNGAYGYHRDEFLYAAQAEHMSWGYMSVPPFTALMAWLSATIGGESLFALRFVPALFGALHVLVVGWMVTELGGGKRAVWLGCLAYICAPAFLASNTLFMPVTFNQFFWSLTAACFIRWIRTQEPRMWAWIGVSAGIGLMNKYSIAFFLLGLTVGLLLTSQRKILLSRYPWLAIGIALLIFAPNLYWQLSLSWPVMGHMNELAETQLVHVEPLGFFFSQFRMTLVTVPVWVRV